MFLTADRVDTQFGATEAALDMAHPIALSEAGIKSLERDYKS